MCGLKHENARTAAPVERQSVKEGKAAIDASVHAP
jgi:hypothetical protein